MDKEEDKKNTLFDRFFDKIEIRELGGLQINQLLVKASKINNINFNRKLFNVNNISYRQLKKILNTALKLLKLKVYN